MISSSYLFSSLSGNRDIDFLVLSSTFLEFFTIPLYFWSSFSEVPEHFSLTLARFYLFFILLISQSSFLVLRMISYFYSTLRIRQFLKEVSPSYSDHQALTPHFCRYQEILMDELWGMIKYCLSILLVLSAWVIIHSLSLLF
jgi:hypothetical protein